MSQLLGVPVEALFETMVPAYLVYIVFVGLVAAGGIIAWTIRLFIKGDLVTGRQHQQVIAELVIWREAALNGIESSRQHAEAAQELTEVGHAMGDVVSKLQQALTQGVPNASSPPPSRER